MVLKNLEKYNIILGSKSPRRQHLLNELGINFEVVVMDGIKEVYPPELKNTEIPVYLAELKANSYQSYMKDDSLLITADTIVWIDNKVLGKPEDSDNAFRIIKQLSGNMHQVITGVCLLSKHKKITFHAITDVFFSKLTDDEITFYIENYKPFDKAGGYGIQEFIGYIGVERINGSYFNVMGLPIQKLYSELKSF